MNKQIFDINNLRVASPCSVGWETMTGDERVRRCQSCELNVYNISEITGKEVENLIAKREDRVCIRFYKRADGTVLTKDCPVGFRAYQKRAARFAGATLAAILGLFSVSFGQKEDKKSIDASKIKIVRTENQSQGGTVKGALTDPMGAVIAGAEIKLYKKGGDGEFKNTTNEDGLYFLNKISDGTYTLEVTVPGFKKYKVINLEIKSSEELFINIEFQPDGETVTVGIYGEAPMIESNSSSITTKISGDRLRKLPFLKSTVSR